MHVHAIRTSEKGGTELKSGERYWEDLERGEEGRKEVSGQENSPSHGVLK